MVTKGAFGYSEFRQEKFRNIAIADSAAALEDLGFTALVLPEEESSASKTSSRTHFQVLGLEASSPRKLPCPRFEDCTIT